VSFQIINRGSAGVSRSPSEVRGSFPATNALVALMLLRATVSTILVYKTSVKIVGSI